MDSVDARKAGSPRRRSVMIPVPRLSVQEAAVAEMEEMQGIANPDSHSKILDEILFGTDSRVDAILYATDPFTGEVMEELTDYDPLDRDVQDLVEIDGYLVSAGGSNRAKGMDWDDGDDVAMYLDDELDLDWLDGEIDRHEREWDNYESLSAAA